MTAFDTRTEAAAVRLEAIRRAPPAARLAAAVELSEIARVLLAEGIRRRHPEYDEAAVLWAVRRRWLPPALFRAAYPGAPSIEP